MMRRLLSFVLLSSIVCILSQSTHAQLRVEIDSINTNAFPDITLYVRVMEGHSSVQGMGVSSFTIIENGSIVPILGGFCLDTISRGPVSVLLVIDISGSMGPWPLGSNAIVDARRAAKSFVDRLSIEDEAALMSFNDQVYFNQNWTNDWTLLKNRIDQLRASGGTALWDAVVSGSSVIQNRTKKKVMIVMTDGRDNVSAATASSARTAAINAGTVVYTIGLGRDLDENALQNLANATGGRYFHAPDAADLDQIYAEINLELVTTGICELDYRSPIDCWNGDEVSVEVQALTPRGVAYGSTRYYLPYDESTFSYVTLSMERNFIVEAGERITIPLELERVSVERAPSVFDFSIDFDTQLLTLVDASVTSLSTGYIPTVTPTQRGASLFMSGVTPIIEPGTLLELTFDAVALPMSRKTEISISPPDVQQFCTEASSFNGLLTVSGYCERALGSSKTSNTGIGASLLSTSPNPLNQDAVIRYSVTGDTHARITVHDILGRRVATLVDGPVERGEHSVSLNANSFDEAVYIITLTTPFSVASHRVMVLK